MKSDEIERELQFEAPDLGRVERWISSQPAYAPLTFRPDGAGTQKDTYLDTEDWAVYRAGYALRMRQKASGGEVTLKALASSATGVQQRREINQPIDAYETPLTSPSPSLVLSIVEGTERGNEEVGSSSAETLDSVSQRVRLISNNRPVRSLFEVETHRTNYAIQQGTSRLAVLSLDATRIMAGGSEVRSLTRVEVEETAPGALAPIGALIDVLSQACDLTPAATSKFAAGLEALGLSPDSALDFGDTELSPDASAGAYAYAILRRFFADFMAHEPGTRLGEDVEELHDMRVATRRLRAAMSLFRKALPLRMGPLRDELQWVGRTLGEVRDLDVYLAWLTEERARSDWMDGIAVGLLIEDVEKSRARARHGLIEAMSTARYSQVIESMQRTLREGEPGGAEAAVPITNFGAKMLRKRYKRMRRGGNDLREGSPAESFHAVRVATKHLRYAVEALAPVFPRRARHLINATRDVQDLLGEHQDAVVAIERLRSIITLADATDLPAAAVFHTGELAERQRSRMRGARESWPEAFADLKRAHRAFAKQLHEVDQQAVEGQTRVEPAMEMEVQDDSAELE